MSIILLKYSVIIPTYNRAKTLTLTLDSIINQTLSFNKYEILVVDDGSTDDTKEVVSNFQKKYPSDNIRYFYEQNGGPAKARNLGIKEAKGEIIFFTDDDCVVPPNWMETLLDGYRRYPGVVGVGGWYKYSNESSKNKYFQKYIDFGINKNREMFEVENKTNIFGSNLAGNTANMSYKKEILEEVGGFDENLYFPGVVDWELKKNIQGSGYYFLYVPLMVNHLKIFNFINFLKQSFNQGRGRYYMFLKYPGLSSYNINFFNFLKRLILYTLNDQKFIFAYFARILCFFLACCYVKYIKPFKNIGSVKELKKPNAETFSVEKRNIKDNTVVTTRFSKFNKDRILSTEIKSDSKFFSIVVPTYNRLQGLINSLNHLIVQTIPNDCYEIIIIDDGSTDDIELQIAKYKIQNTKYNIRYFKTENGGPAKARNKGIKESKGEIIFFTDDDCTVPPNWMETLLDGYRRYPELSGVGGWYIPPEGELLKSAVSRCLHFESFFSHLFFKYFLQDYEIISNDPKLCFGTFAYNTANVCYRRKILEEVNSFREDFYWPGSEDNDLAFRITSAGHSLLYLPFHVIHPKAMSLPDFTKLYFHRGANGYLLRITHQELLEKINPGFVKYYGSIASFIYHFNGPEKFLTLLQWLSINAGIIYMKNKLTLSGIEALTKHNNPVLSKPKEKIGND